MMTFVSQQTLLQSDRLSIDSLVKQRAVIGFSLFVDGKDASNFLEDEDDFLCLPWEERASLSFKISIFEKAGIDIRGANVQLKFGARALCVGEKGKVLGAPVNVSCAEFQKGEVSRSLPSSFQGIPVCTRQLLETPSRKCRNL